MPLPHQLRMSLHCLSLTAFSHGTVLRGGAPGRFCERRTRGRKQGKETGGVFGLPLFYLKGDGHALQRSFCNGSAKESCALILIACSHWSRPPRRWVRSPIA